MKQLAVEKVVCTSKRGVSDHEFCINDSLNHLNLKLLKRIHAFDIKQAQTLDYDNTYIFSDKADARNTYLKQYGYAPAVGFIGKQVVYVENRKGNTDARTLQEDTLERMFAMHKQQDSLVSCRLVITKEKRENGQIDLFTGDNSLYSAIITNDYELSDDQVVFFYNKRGAIEREFDVLKNDFAWDKMPFSKIEQNTVFLIITAICRNLYEFIINTFSKMYANLSPNFRLKKFIFRFICIPAKWIRSARGHKLRLYGQLYFRT